MKKGVQTKWLIRGGLLINLIKRNPQTNPLVTHTRENTKRGLNCSFTNVD